MLVYALCSRSLSCYQGCNCGYALLELGDSSQLAIICINACAAGSPVRTGACSHLHCVRIGFLALAGRVISSALADCTYANGQGPHVHLQSVRTSPLVQQRAEDCLHLLLLTAWHLQDRSHARIYHCLFIAGCLPEFVRLHTWTKLRSSSAGLKHTE